MESESEVWLHPPSEAPFCPSLRHPTNFKYKSFKVRWPWALCIPPVPQAVPSNSYLHNTTRWSLSLAKTTGLDLTILDIKSSEKLVQEGKWETYRQGPELDADAHSLMSTLQRCDHFHIVTSSCWWVTKPWGEKRTPVIWLACLERLGFKSIKLNPHFPHLLSLLPAPLELLLKREYEITKKQWPKSLKLVWLVWI